MRPAIARLALALVAGLAAPAARAADFPLASSKLSLKDGAVGAKRKVSLQARFTGDAGTMNPNFDGATLRLYGGRGEGDSGLIRLGPNWRPLPGGKGFRYNDPRQSAGGIRTILLRRGRHGGRLEITGGAANWAYEVTRPQTIVTATLTIGEAKWCAQFTNPHTKRRRVVAQAAKALASCPCEQFASTWQAIQTVVFERNGCTSAACHGSATGAAASGGLDLRPEVAYENLVNVFSELGQMDRVEPGSPTNDSFLWRKLAAKTSPGRVTGAVPGTPMPNGLPAIRPEELEAIRLWIQYSAQKEGVVAGTEGLLNSCLPPAEPPHLEPPAPPAAGTGVQYYAPPWPIKPEGEDEVCYATYHNVADQIPDEFKTPCPDFWGGPSKTCYFFNRFELTQEPNSHHSIIHIYRGAFGLDAPGFDHVCRGGALRNRPCNPANPAVSAPEGGDCGEGGECVSAFDFRCGGRADGTPCDPRVAGACDTEACSGVWKSSLACLTFGPPDFSGVGSVNGTGSANAPSVGGSQQPFSRTVYPPGVFAVLPAEAIWVWNSHAFNVTREPTVNQQWYNLYFAPAEDRRYFIRTLFDDADIFVQDVPPFERREYCRTVTFGKGTRLFELSSHTHKRGRLFRGWGPGIAPRCRSTFEDASACVAETTTPILTTTQYNDPTQLRFTTPLALDSDDPAARTFKFCSVFDNGWGDPNEVKRNSESPFPPTYGTLAPGGPCLVPGSNGFSRDLGIVCLNGPKRGQPCESAGPVFGADDRLCDSSPGARDGICDACPLRGGVTTEDEMFIPLGSYYCDPSVPGESCTLGMCDGGPKWGERCTGVPGECGRGFACSGYIN